jgi:WD40 repeat protein
LLIGLGAWFATSGTDPREASAHSEVELGRHTTYVSSVSFAPEGQTVLTSSYDHTIALWSAVREGNGSKPEERRPVMALPHDSEVIDALFSPDGRSIVSVDKDEVTYWNIAPDGVRVIHRLQGSYHCLAFNADGSQIALGRKDGSIEILSTQDRRSTAVLKSHRDRIFRVAFAPGAYLLASTSVAGDVKLWNTVTGKELGPIASGKARNQALAFSPDGTLLALGESDGGPTDLSLWDVSRSRCLCSLSGHTGGISDLEFSHDGRFLVSGGRDGTIRFWDPAKGTMLAVLRDRSGLIGRLSLSPDDSLLAFVSGSTIRLIDLRKDATIASKVSSLLSAGDAGVSRPLAFSSESYNRGGSSASHPSLTKGENDAQMVVPEEARRL